MKPRLRAFLRWLGASGVVFALGLVVLGSMPLTHLLGYEYSAAVSALLCTVGVFRTISRTKASPVWTSYVHGMTDLAGLAAIALIVGLLLQLRVTNCDVPGGIHYFLVLAVGAIPWAAGVALFATRCVPRHPHLAAGAVLLVSVSTTLAFLALQPPIVAHNPIVGYWAGSIYDESLVGRTPHLLFRVFTTASAVAWVALLAWGAHRRRRDLVRAAIAVAVAFGIWSMRADWGIERGRGWIEQELGGFARTEHFDIYYDASYFDERRVQHLIADHEARWDELVGLLGAAPSGRLRSWVYGSNTRRGDMMGGYRTLVAKIWLGEMHITWSGVGDEMLAHELAHLLLRDHGTGPLRLSAKWGVLPHMALVEGAATAAAWGASDLDYHAWASAMYELGVGESVADILGPTGFWSAPGRRAYTLAGSFCRWLIDDRGTDRFLLAYRQGDFERAYGMSLNELELEWRRFLEERELAPELLELARYRYDRPTLFGRKCARHVSTTLDEARRLVARRRFAEAEACIESLDASDPEDLRLQYDLARLDRLAGRTARARTRIQRILAHEDAGTTLQLVARELLGDIAWAEGDTAAAEASYRTGLASAAVDADVRRLRTKLDGVEAVHDAPRSSRAVHRYLVATPSPTRASSIAELLLAHHAEELPVTAYLAGIALAGEPSDAVPRLLRDEVLDGLDPVRHRFAVQSLARWEFLDGERDRGCALWARLYAESAVGSASQAEARMWHGRCSRPDPSMRP